MRQAPSPVELPEGDADAEVRGGRGRLLAAAQRLFAQSGFHEVSVSQIVECSGVQAPSLYYHFQGKEGLYLSWCQLALSALRERIVAALATTEPLDVRLGEVAMALLDPLAPDPLMLRRDATHLRPDASEALIRLLFQSLYEPLLNAFVESISARDLRQEPVDMMAHLFIVMALGLRSPYSLHNVPREEAAQMTANAFLQGFARRGLG